MAEEPFPAAFKELAFVQSYHRSALRKPQVVADSLLRSLVTSGQDDRLLIAAAIGGELAEACRRLVAVHDALNDRRRPVGVSLLAPLPGAEAWLAFANRAASIPPEAMLRDLAIGEDAQESAVRLRGQPNLGWVTPLIAAAEAGSMQVLFPTAEPNKALAAAWIGAASGGAAGEGMVAVGEEDAATLADMTADMVSIARGFLGSYLRARLGAGRVERDG
jgi:hypothetical protein